MTWLYLIGLLLQIVQLYGIYLLTRQRTSRREVLDKSTVAPSRPDDAATAEPFAVDAKPRSIPWPIRRKQLRDAARTKRAKMEEWRES